MTTLDRANALLKSRAVKLALTVIPLGMFAVSAAQAAIVGSYNLCAPGTDPGSCVFTPTLSVVATPFNAGDQSTATPTSSFSASPTAVGGVTVTGGFGMTADVAGDYLFTLDLTGPTSGIPLGTTGGVAYYDANIDTGAGGSLGGLIQFFVTQGTDFTGSFPVAGSGHFANTVALGPFDPTLSIDKWEMIFTFDWVADAGNTLAVDFPLTEDPTPEPVSVLLVGSGIGLLSLLRRWRKA